MASYIILGNFTDQGIRHVKDTTKRAEALTTTANALGVTIKSIYWTLGRYDAIIAVEAADDATATALGLSLGALGNVRTQTLPAFSAVEMNRILAKMV
jgi:uncharacterized protein with GYD domain